MPPRLFLWRLVWFKQKWIFVLLEYVCKDILKNGYCFISREYHEHIQLENCNWNGWWQFFFLYLANDISQPISISDWQQLTLLYKDSQSNPSVSAGNSYYSNNGVSKPTKCVQHDRSRSYIFVFFFVQLLIMTTKKHLSGLVLLSSWEYWGILWVKTLNSEKRGLQTAWQMKGFYSLTISSVIGNGHLLSQKSPIGGKEMWNSHSYPTGFPVLIGSKTKRTKKRIINVLQH